MKMLVFILAVFVSSQCLAAAPRTIYTDRSGGIQMKGYDNGNGVTRYYGPTGQRLGYSYQSGSRVNYYSQNGSHSGSATAVGNGFRYFNSNGSKAGRSK
jgi:hypothetical protein